MAPIPNLKLNDGNSIPVVSKPVTILLNPFLTEPIVIARIWNRHRALEKKTIEPRLQQRSRRNNQKCHQARYPTHWRSRRLRQRRRNRYCDQRVRDSARRTLHHHKSSRYQGFARIYWCQLGETAAWIRRLVSHCILQFSSKVRLRSSVG